MIIPEQITKLTAIINSEFIWLYIIILLIIMYLIISLLTWSFIKPLKYLGIPTCIVGILLLIIRFLPDILLPFTKYDISIVKKVLPSILKPILIYGVLCFLLGIVMIVTYKIINKYNKRETNEIK